jgi:pimeloyl-ACP methyl ester carboxylesterase
MLKKSGLLLFCWLIVASSGLAMDADREKFWDEEVRNKIKVGKAESLQAGDHKFLSIFTQESSNFPQGGILLLHGHSGHPDWPELIKPLRTRLPDFGWSTLSMQMPVPKESTSVLEYEPLLKEASKRIEAGVSFLQSKGIRNIVLVGHGLGASMGAYHLSTASNKNIKAYIGIGMGILRTKPELEVTQLMEKIRIPILDIYGMNDRPEVTRSAPDRIRSAKRGATAAFNRKDVEMLKQSIRATRPNSKTAGFVSFRQIKIEGANHFFTHQEDDLIKRIRGWLNRHAPGGRAKRK